MDVVVKGRHTDVPERFRQHVVEKLGKVPRLDPKVIRVDVEVSRERNPRLSDQCERVELTCSSRGPVIRAEACAADRYAALDLAWAKLEARLRRSADRRRVHHGVRTPVSVAVATAPAVVSGPVTGPVTGPVGPRLDGAGPARAGEEPAGEVPVHAEGPIEVRGEGPLVVREKTHEAAPMTLEQALYEMELVGHDFFLFVDAESQAPSVVYRRRGYDYGVIRLAV